MSDPTTDYHARRASLREAAKKIIAIDEPNPGKLVNYCLDILREIGRQERVEKATAKKGSTGKASK